MAILGLLENVMASDIISRISTETDQLSNNAHSRSPSISADGRYITFHSDATHLVPDDNNGFTDIFVYDHRLKQINRINVSSTGEEANFISVFPKISADGRYVVFQSDAANLVPDDNNHTSDIFIYDQNRDQIDLVSINTDGEQSNSAASEPVISADGRYVAFQSSATNLVKQDRNKKMDIFIRDRQQQETTLVSINSQGRSAQKGSSFGAALSADGRYVAFSSEAANLVENDTNEVIDVFVRDREKGETIRVSINSAGEAGDKDAFSAAIAAEGRYVAFRSKATNLVENDTNDTDDIFVYDLDTGETVRVSVDSEGQQSNGPSFDPNLSVDGRYVLFNSEASNLVTHDDNDNTDVFIHDRHTGKTRSLTLGSRYKGLRASAYSPVISHDGRWVAFESKASNLVSGDFNRATDIFLYDRDYYASYETTTGQLTIPVLTVPGFGLFKASLTLLDETSQQFVLDKTRSVPLPLEDIPSIYTVETGLLQLPKLEIFTSLQEVIQCEAEMQSNSQLTQFIVTQLHCHSESF